MILCCCSVPSARIRPHGTRTKPLWVHFRNVRACCHDRIIDCRQNDDTPRQEVHTNSRTRNDGCLDDGFRIHHLYQLACAAHYGMTCDQSFPRVFVEHDSDFVVRHRRNNI